MDVGGPSGQKHIHNIYFHLASAHHAQNRNVTAILFAVTCIKTF